jgi:hypothetical protein
MSELNSQERLSHSPVVSVGAAIRRHLRELMLTPALPSERARRDLLDRIPIYGGSQFRVDAAGITGDGRATISWRSHPSAAYHCWNWNDAQLHLSKRHF